MNIRHVPLATILLFSLLQFHCTGSKTLGEKNVKLHVNNGKWPDCAMEFDPSLTQEDFREFSAEAATIVFFKPMVASKVIHGFEFSLSNTTTGRIDDTQRRWNDTFTHPDSAHSLVDQSGSLKFPQLNFRMGISETMDAGLYFTKNPTANYGFTGADVRYQFLADTSSHWYSTSRISYSRLFGVEDLDYSLLSLDASVTRDFGYLKPYGGIALMLSDAKETTDKVALDKEIVWSLVGILGVEMSYEFLDVAFEADLSRLNMYNVKIGLRF